MSGTRLSVCRVMPGHLARQGFRIGDLKDPAQLLIQLSSLSAGQLFSALLLRPGHSAVKRSKHTVAPASSRTVMRHSVPCQKVQPRSLSISPAVVIAWVRAAARSWSTIPSTSGRSAPSLTLKKYRGIGCFRNRRAEALAMPLRHRRSRGSQPQWHREYFEVSLYATVHCVAVPNRQEPEQYTFHKMNPGPSARVRLRFLDRRSTHRGRSTIRIRRKGKRSTCQTGGKAHGCRDHTIGTAPVRRCHCR
jgi:hypothetical protein